MSNIRQVLYIGLLIFSKISMAEPFRINSNNISIGGDATAIFNINLDSTIKLDLSIKPALSFIALTNWEFGFRPIVNIAIVRQVPLANRVEWGINVFSRGYWEMRENFYYYLGASLGTRIFDFDARSWKGVVGIESGMLIGLSNNIALDFGIPLIMHLNRNSGVGYLEIPMGYLGVKAFF